MKVSQFAVGTRRFVAFVNEDEIPVRPLANAFIYDEFIHAAFSTKVRVAQELKTVLDYFDSKSIVLESRMASDKLLTTPELTEFYGKMMLRKESFDISDKISVIPNVQSKRIRNAIKTSIHRTSKVSVETRTGRVRTFRKYLNYLFTYFHGYRKTPKGLEESFELLIARIKAKENYSTSKTRITPIEFAESVIPDDVYKRFLEVIQPKDSNNPFKGSRIRNYLILSIMDQAGLRRSEVCKIKISDCQFHGDSNKIKIYSSADDHSDPRLNRPNNKTGRAHISGINANLMKEIQTYIYHIRNTHLKSRMHDFLFVSEKNTHGTAGLPITREMINYIFSKVSSVLNFKIHPHLLRHKWNERLSERGLAKGLDREYVEDLRKNAMGWQPDSQMGRLYNDKHEQLMAIKLMTEHQDKVDGTNK